MTESAVSASQRPVFEFVIAAALAVLALALNAVVLGDLVVTGPFAWHYRQVGAIEGGAELIGLLVLVFGALLLPRATWRGGALFVVVGLYLRRHGVDGPALLALLYIELMLACGVLVLRAVRADAVPGLERTVLATLLGIGVLTSCFLIASAAGYGTAGDLRIVVLVVAVPVFVLARARPATLIVFERIGHATVAMKLGFATLIAWLAAMVARTNNVLSYDSAWYGLRGDLVLAPAHSLFERTGLVSPVYYFPKLFELLLLPFNGIPDFSFALGFNTGLYALVALAAYAVAKRVGATPAAALVATLIAVTLPAVANLALSTKPDMLSLLCLLLAAYWACAFVRAPEWPTFVLAVLATGFAVLAKIASAPFGVAIILAMLLAVAWRTPGAPADAWRWRVAFVAMGLVALVGAGLTARSWLLTGMPTIGPDPLVKLWLALGFTFREPVGTLNWLQPQVWADVPALIGEFLFAPSKLAHIAITWTGNVWLWLALVAAIAWVTGDAPTREARRLLLLAALPALCGVWLAIGQRYVERGGDGNYFMFAPVVAILALTPYAMRFAQRGRAGALMHVAFAVFIAFQASYAFVSANWDPPGTRAWDTVLDRSVFDTPDVLRRQFAATGYTEIAEWLAEQPRPLRVVALGGEGECFLVRARCEPASTMFHARQEYFASEVAFARYINLARIDALIVPLNPVVTMPFEPVVLSTADQWRAQPTTQSIRSRDFELLVRSRRAPRAPETAAERAEKAP